MSNTLQVAVQGLTGKRGYSWFHRRFFVRHTGEESVVLCFEAVSENAMIFFSF